jgi:hypothetical protein
MSGMYTMLVVSAGPMMRFYILATYRLRSLTLFRRIPPNEPEFAQWAGRNAQLLSGLVSSASQGSAIRATG